MPKFQIDGKEIEYIKTEVAAQWLGVHVSTLYGKTYRKHIASFLDGRTRYWRVSDVLTFDRRKFDGRRK